MAIILAQLGCHGPQSGLAPAGKEASQIADLFWWMTGGALFVWLSVIVLGVYAIRVKPEWGIRRANAIIIVGGAVFPTVVLAGLLTYGLWMLPGLVAPAPEGSLRIAVDGERWWWRVRYPTPDGEVELANEIRLPVGEPVEFQLNSSNVIHSFWIPSLGGKIDMIPGRQTRLTLTPTKTGTFRGACAEFCGEAHALMNFNVVVLEKAEFSRWLEREAAPAREPETPLEFRGREQFLANGCAACHTIRGTPASGVIGPDLTHVGSRTSLGAGILPDGRERLLDWITRPNHLKPGVLMPAFKMLPSQDVEAIATYLESLE